MTAEPAVEGGMAAAPEKAMVMGGAAAAGGGLDVSAAARGAAKV
jgi:hypothetical protein